MKIPPKTPLWRRTALGMALLFWIAGILLHYFSWSSISDFAFVPTLLSSLDQAQIAKLAGNWLSFLKTMGAALCAILVLWRLGIRMTHWMGVKAGSRVVNFCLEMALGILGLNALWLGLGFNGLWESLLLWTLAGAFTFFSLLDSYRGFMKIQKFPGSGSPGNFYLFLGLFGRLLPPSGFDAGHGARHLL